MSSTADSLEQEIESLADADKLRIVEAIRADLNRPDPEIDRILAEEARKRWDAYKAGRLGTVFLKRSCPNTETNENPIPGGTENRYIGLIESQRRTSESDSHLAFLLIFQFSTFSNRTRNQNRIHIDVGFIFG